MGRVSQHGVLDLANRRRAVVPGFVGEVGIGRNRENLDTKLLELFVVISQVFEFGWADKGKVCRIEHEYRPLASNAFVGELDELTIVVSHGFERQDLSID